VPDKRLAVNGVSVSYGSRNNRVRALDDVSIQFEPGELTLVMGPSGSGKTTLLSLLGCLLTPDRGSVSVEGMNPSDLDKDMRARLRSRIGFVFQAFRLFHSLPALENVLISADISGERKSHAARALELLEGVGLGSKLRLKPDELSGGEKQRVAICRALLMDPRTILADEPTASLDFQAGEQIREIFREISNRQDRTVVVVSHDPRWVPCADRVVVLEDGRILNDTRDTTCERSQSLFQLAQL